MYYLKTTLVLLLTASAASAQIEFTGYFVAGGRASVALSDTETKATAWLHVGDQFEKYTVIDYIVEEEIVKLSGPEGTIAIRLKADAKVKAGRFTVTGSFRIGEGASVKVSAATLELGVENMMPLDEKVRLLITPEVMADGNMRYRNKFERKEPDGRFEVFSAPSVNARPNQKFGIKVGQYEYSFDPEKA